LDILFLALYTVEAALKIGALGFVLNKGSYLRDGWNMLDFLIIFTGYLPYLLAADSSSSFSLNSLRALRILRPLRTISSVKALRQIIHALLDALPMLCETFAVLMFVFLIFGIAGLQLF
jgi:hypothetical protein